MHVPKELQDKCLKYSFSFVNVILEVCLGFKKHQVLTKCSLHKLSFHSTIPCIVSRADNNRYKQRLLVTFHGRTFSQLIIFISLVVPRQNFFFFFCMSFNIFLLLPGNKLILLRGHPDTRIFKLFSNWIFSYFTKLKASKNLSSHVCSSNLLEFE